MLTLRYCLLQGARQAGFHPPRSTGWQTTMGRASVQYRGTVHQSRMASRIISPTSLGEETFDQFISLILHLNCIERCAW
jgi:hypothetical protein